MDAGKSRSVLLIGALAVAFSLLSRLDMPALPENFGGFANESFAKVQKVFKSVIFIIFSSIDANFPFHRKNFHDGWEREGAALAVYYKGELVVDLYGGYADASALRKWTPDTRTVVFSATKVKMIDWG